MKGFFYFFKYALKKQPLYILFSITLTLLDALSPVLLLYIPKFILDAAQSGFQDEAVKFLAIYAVCYIILNICIHWLSYGTTFFSSKLFACFQMDMAEKLLDADLEQLESKDFLELSEKAKKYIYADGYGFGYIFQCSLRAIQYILTAVSYIIVILQFSPLLVLINLFFTCLSYFIEGSIKKKEKADRDQQVAHERKTSYFINITTDAAFTKDIRLFTYKPVLLKKMGRHYDLNNRFYSRINRRHMIGLTISSIFFIIQIVAGYIFVISLLVNKQISVGDFTLYVSALTAYASQIGQILDKIVFVRSFDLYFNDFKAYMDIPSMKGQSDRGVDREKPLTIEFQNVSFRYGGAKTYALKNINLTIHGDDRVAIVGENGSGKSTFLKLLMRLYDPTEGKILVNGVDVREYDYDDYMRLFSAVFQDYALFAATIGENITMDDAEKPDEGFVQELHDIGLLSKVIESYPKHFDTQVYRIFDEEGIEPSGGEGQQIAIARSLFKRNARINILDEPTAALDPKIEHDLYQKYDQITRKNLSFFISHRLGSCQFANRILVFSKGEIIEDGAHEELLAKEGVYHQLYQYQASMYQKDAQQST